MVFLRKWKRQMGEGYLKAEGQKAVKNLPFLMNTDQRHLNNCTLILIPENHEKIIFPGNHCSIVCVIV